jgi:hypothetical protein
MRRALLLVALVLPACTPPEAERTRGGGPGADVGNRGSEVVLHERRRPEAEVPLLVPGSRPAETTSP